MSEPTAPDLAAQLQAAIAHHQAGELAEAEQGYRAILAEQANHPDAWHNLGILALQVEQHDTALELLRGVLQAYPQHGQFWISYLQALMRIGQFDLARAVLAQGRELGLDGEPVDAIARQLELLPGAAPDTPGEATPSTDTAAQTDTPTQEETPTAAETAEPADIREPVEEPTPTEPLAPTATETTEPADIREPAQEPTPAEPLALTATEAAEPAAVLEPQEAVASAAIPDQPETITPAAAFEPTPMPAEAETDHDPQALAQGLAALAAQRYTEAWRKLRQASRQQGDEVEVWLALGEACQGLGRLDEAAEAWRQALTLEPANWAAESALLRLSQLQPALSAAAAAERHLSAGATLEAHWPEPAAPTPRQAHDALRVGFIGPGLCDHPHAQVLLPLWQALASSSLEVWAYHDAPHSDAITERLRAACAGWREVAGLDDDSLLAQIIADDIDILVDLHGHQPGNRLAVFARQAAPLQVGWLGHADGSGLSRMHWRLTDAATHPAGVEAQHREQLWRLADGQYCHQPLWHVLQQRPSSDYAVRGAPALHRGHVTFGACLPAAQLNGEVIALWAQVLHAVADSRLRLELPGLDASDSPLHVALSTQFAERGIGGHRLQLLPHDPSRLAVRAHDIDIALDSFPVSVGLSACELLWMGVPVITLPGARPASRAAASLLTTLGCPQWIAHSKVDYVRIAKTLASDLPQLNRTRLSLRVEMESSPLRQPQRFAEQVETALRGMWAARS